MNECYRAHGNRRTVSLLWLLISVIGIGCAWGSNSLAAQDPFELAALDGFGREDSPVTFSAEDVRGARPGTEVVVTVVAKIDRGWHIYGFDMDPELGVPTTMYVTSSGDLEMPGEIQEPSPHEREDELIGGLLLEHEGNVEFKIPLRVPEGAADGPRKVLVDITYQACDAKECYLPQTLHFDLPLKFMGHDWDRLD